MKLQELIDKISDYVKISNEDIDLDKPIMEMGFDSQTLTRFVGELEQELHVKLDMAALINYPTINKFYQYLTTQIESKETRDIDKNKKRNINEKVAITGIACKFPGADDVDEFFNNLKSQKLSVIPYPENRKKLCPDCRINLDEKIYDGGYLDDVEMFDNEYFSISKTEATDMDPQQRILLQEVVHALEDADITEKDIKNMKIGVFVGASNADYLRTVLPKKKDISAVVGNSMAMLSNRVSYFFDFRGPSMTIDTACSSSLVAVNEAIESIDRRECDVAIVAGVNIILDPEINKAMGEAGMLSPDGLCQTFDKNANGYVRGEGIGVVVIKRLSDAEIRGDRIYATIIGKAINQDGRSASLTAPNKGMQVDLLKNSVANSGIEASDVRYIEAHGTGTFLGDYIEVSAIDEAINQDLRRRKPLLLGSVKTNIGHLESAAGIASLIKMALCLYHGVLVPTRNVDINNERLELEQKNIHVVQNIMVIEDEQFICGINSFGFGGTNCNIMLNRYRSKEQKKEFKNKENYIFPLSDVSQAALDRRIQNFCNFIQKYKGSLNDIEYTLTQRTNMKKYRKGYVAKNKDELLKKLGDINVSGKKSKINSRVALVFSGQGTQWIGMGRELNKYPAYREMFEKCTKKFNEIGQCDLDQVINSNENKLDDSYFAQPAIFAIQVSIASLLKKLGINYSVVCGHSLGEIAAAFVSGAITLDSAVKIIHYRSNILRRFTGKGRMLAASLSEKDSLRYLKGYNNTSIGVINATESVVISGIREEVEEIEKKFNENNISCKYLPVNYAFHYVGLDPFKRELIEKLGEIRCKPTDVEIISTVTGEPISSKKLDAYYWADNMRNTVRFSEATKYIVEKSDIVIEVSPSSALMLYLLKYGKAKNINIIASQKRNYSPIKALLEAVSQLFSLGMDINWNALNIKGNRVFLPKYLFAKNKIWPQIERKQKIVRSSDGLQVRKNATQQEIAEFVTNLISATIYEKILVTSETKIADLDIDSLKLFQLNSKINEKFNISLKITELGNLETIGDLISKIVSYLRIKKEKLTANNEVNIDIDKLVTDGQKAIIRDQLLNKNSNKYNMVGAWKIGENIVLDDWKRACEIVLREQEALKLRFFVSGQQIIQKIVNSDIKIAVTDLSKIEEVDSYVNRVLNEPFDLKKETARVFLGVKAKEVYFGLSIHHSVIDGISMFLLLKKVILTYKQLRLGKETVSKDNSITYIDYQTHESMLKKTKYYQDSKKDLLKKLKKCELVDDFRIYSETNSADQISSEKYLQIQGKLLKKLREFSKSSGYTLFEILYSGYQLLYYKINNNNNFITCTYSSGREETKYYDMIGYFVKNILVPSRINPEESARNFIGKVHRNLFESYPYPAGVTLDYLRNSNSRNNKYLAHTFVYEKPIENVSGTPIFVNGGSEEKNFVIDDIKFKKIDIECTDSQYNLVFMLEECLDKIVVKCQFKKSIYDDRAIDTLLNSYKTLLENILDNVDLPIKSYEISSQSSMFGSKTNLKGKRYHQYLEYFARKYPEKIAVSYEKKNISYAELNYKSNLLARRIFKYTQGKNVGVGVAVEKNELFLVSIFAIMKAGAYYIPLDKNYPKDRLQFIMNNSKMKFMVSDGTFDDMGLKYNKIKIISPTTIDSKDVSDLDLCINLSNSAYMIYTSGTTGNPKGVKVTHFGIENIVKEQARLFNIVPNDRTTFFASVCFDASIFEILMAIGHGATLVFASREKMGSGDKLRKFLKDRKITVTTLPSSILASMENRGLASLRVIITAGEPCTDEIKNSWCGTHELYNAYGVTEATIWNTTSRCRLKKRVMIGNPISNIEIKVVNQDGNLCPKGITGELLIGGVALSEGYFGLEELNKKKFINMDGKRLYKTGDLVRIDYSDEIEYVARMDNQVKINGYRVELEEIEKVIQHQTNIKDAIVVLVHRGNDKQLVSYIKLKSKSNFSEEKIKDNLKQILPHYMIPDRIFSITKMPLTHNGKIDRKILEEIAIDKFKKREIVLPTSSEEIAVVKLLQKYLGNENSKISMTDTLSELGIDSINIYNLLVDVEKSFDVVLNIEDLLGQVSVTELCQMIYKKKNKSDLVLYKKTDDAPIILSEKQKGLWVACQLKPKTHEYNIPIVLKLTGNLDISALNKAWNEIVYRHNVLRTKYYQCGNEILGNIDNEHFWEIPVEDISELDSEKMKLKLNSEVKNMKTINLSPKNFPLFKVKILKTEVDEYYLMFTIHHFIADGWSIKLIFNELKYYYKLYRRRKKIPKRILKYQYEDVGFSESISSSKKSSERYKKYWKDKFEEDSVLNMPEDYSRPHIMDNMGKKVFASIPVKKYEKIVNFVQSRGTTVFSFMTAILGIILRRYSGQENINIGFPILGRNNKYEQEMVGMFIDTTISKVNVDYNLKFDDYLDTVAKEIISSIDMGKFGLNQIIKTVNPPRDLKNTQLFQVLINMIDFDINMDELDDLKVEAIEDDIQDAKYDFTFYLTENNSGLHICLNYYSSVYSQETAQRILSQYIWLAEKILDDSTKKVGEYRLKDKHPVPTMEKLLYSKESNSLAYKALEAISNSNKNIHFEYLGKSYDCEDIQKQIGYIARKIKESKIPKGCVVAISGLRKPQTIATILATLECGLLFTLIDMQWPKGRIANVLKSTNSSYFIDLSTDQINISSIQSKKIRYFLEDSSYIFVTSGTTSTPKSILGSNSAVNHFIDWEIKNFGLSHTDKFAILSGISHDPILRDIFIPLTVGATLVFPNQSEIVKNDLFMYLKENKISVANITPSLAEVIILGSKRYPEERLASLRILFLGGERLKKSTVQKLIKIAPNCRIINYYGTTETPQGMSAIEYHKEELALSGEYLPIGEGIDDVKLSVTDEVGNKLSIGEIGIINVCTKYLSKGYLKHGSNSILPLSSKKNIYSTGDLGRYRKDGQIEILGRKDSQIKRYGQRIELGEIESIFTQYKGISYAKTLFYRDNIYVFVIVEIGFDKQKCQDDIYNYLPVYMRPSQIIVINDLPLTKNGKIDNRKLKRIIDERNETLAKSLELSGTEKIISNEWKKVLNVEIVPIDKSFFEVGGTSMKLLTLQQNLEKVFYQEIPITVLFNNPTISTLAEYLDKKKNENSVKYTFDKAKQRTQKATSFIKRNGKEKK